MIDLRHWIIRSDRTLSINNLFRTSNSSRSNNTSSNRSNTINNGSGWTSNSNSRIRALTVSQRIFSITKDPIPYTNFTPTSMPSTSRTSIKIITRDKRTSSVSGTPTPLSNSAKTRPDIRQLPRKWNQTNTPSFKVVFHRRTTNTTPSLHRKTKLLPTSSASSRAKTSTYSKLCPNFSPPINSNPPKLPIITPLFPPPITMFRSSRGTSPNSTTAKN